MAQAAFHHSPPAGASPEGHSLSLAIFADRPHLRASLRDDALAAGFRVALTDELAVLLDDSVRPPADVVLVDCPLAGGAQLAALARLDMLAAQSGSQLVVGTGVAALDDVFACLDQSAPQILVDPGRAEWVMALGRALSLGGGARVRELSGDDRLVLLRLTEQVDEIARRLERMAATSGLSPADDARVEAPRSAFAFATDDADARLVRRPPPALPDSRLVRSIIRQRQLRARFFDADLFADPAWDMLLDLTAARAEGVQVSVTSLCIASGVPPTTALRWIGQMTGAGLLRRVEDHSDRRRAFIALTDRSAEAMAGYFATLGQDAARLV